MGGLEEEAEEGGPYFSKAQEGKAHAGNGMDRCESSPNNQWDSVNHGNKDCQDSNVIMQCHVL